MSLSLFLGSASASGLSAARAARRLAQQHSAFCHSRTAHDRPTAALSSSRSESLVLSSHRRVNGNETTPKHARTHARTLSPCVIWPRNLPADKYDAQCNTAVWRAKQSPLPSPRPAAPCVHACRLAAWRSAGFEFPAGRAAPEGRMPSELPVQWVPRSCTGCQWSCGAAQLRLRSGEHPDGWWQSESGREGGKEGRKGGRCCERQAREEVLARSSQQRRGTGTRDEWPSCTPRTRAARRRRLRAAPFSLSVP